MTMSHSSNGVIPALDQPLRLEVARRHWGGTQRELADVLGIGVSTVQRAEQGIARPKRATVIAWAFATGVSLDWLENGDRPQPVEVEGERNAVRHQGLEPRTRWLIALPGHSVVIDLETRRRASA